VVTPTPQDTDGGDVIFLVRGVIVIVSLCIAVSGNAQGESKAFMPEYERGHVTCIEKKSLQQRSNISFALRQIKKDNKILYKLTRQGRGDYDTYKTVDWTMEAEMEENEGFLYTLYSKLVIKNKEEKVMISYGKRYDYDAGQIYWSAFDANGQQIQQQTFPVKGRTADDVTMIHFLKPFVARRNEEAHRMFYLLTNEPKLYKTKIKVIGSEIVQSPFGETRAVKLKLTADVGILDDVLDKFVPPTFIWYTEEKPYVWLKYQGFESGALSPYIIANLQTIELARALNPVQGGQSIAGGERTAVGIHEQEDMMSSFTCQ
jgi:hypothetical protein